VIGVTRGVVSVRFIHHLPFTVPIRKRPSGL
jgi:hypothetical protein